MIVAKKVPIGREIILIHIRYSYISITNDSGQKNAQISELVRLVSLKSATLEGLSCVIPLGEILI